MYMGVPFHLIKSALRMRVNLFSTNQVPSFTRDAIKLRETVLREVTSLPIGSTSEAHPAVCERMPCT